MTALDAIDFVISLEGGYVSDANDPGGATNMGISQRAYPNLNIQALTRQDAEEIYMTDYWIPMSLDAAPSGVALLKYDAAVNQGLTFAHSLPNDLIGIATARALRYVQNQNFALYGKGWFNRLFAVFQRAVQP